MKHRNPAPQVYQALFARNEPVRVRPEFLEEVPAHADMCRYDNAFHSPADASLVIFPLFRHKTAGMYPDKITVARWSSFSIHLEFAHQGEHQSFDYIADHPIGDWITYQHPDGNTAWNRLP